MSTVRMAGPVTALALLAIRGYQRWLSPRKGFRCAHAVHHGGPGCSGYAMQAIGQRGFFGALGAIRQRFCDCRAAFEVLKMEQSGGADEEGGGEAGDDKKPGFLGNACPSAAAPCTPGTLPGLSACGIGGAEGAGSACSACDLGAISCCG